MLPIYIPSRSRWQRSLTLERLGQAVLRGRRVLLVVPTLQALKYAQLAKAHGLATVLGTDVSGISGVRRFIGAHAARLGHEKFIMLDDDLMFAHRVRQDSVALEPSNERENLVMLGTVDEALDDYAHVAISARQANNGLHYPVEVCSRALRALAFRTELFNSCEHGRVQVMEDFDVQLQLLARGWPNVVLSHWAQDQRATNMPGGCSDYRSVGLHNKNVQRMAKLWPPHVVKLREKHNKTGQGQGLASRLEATIYWKKALGLYAKELT